MSRKKKLPKFVWPPKAHDDPTRFTGMDAGECRERMKELQAQLGRRAGVALDESASLEDREFAALGVDWLSDQIDVLRERIDTLENGIKLENHYLLLPLAHVYEQRRDARSMFTCIAIWLAIRHGLRVTPNSIKLPFVHPRELAEAVRYFEQSGWREHWQPTRHLRSVK